MFFTGFITNKQFYSRDMKKKSEKIRKSGSDASHHDIHHPAILKIQDSIDRPFHQYLLAHHSNVSETKYFSKSPSLQSALTEASRSEVISLKIMSQMQSVNPGDKCIILELRIPVKTVKSFIEKYSKTEKLFSMDEKYQQIFYSDEAMIALYKFIMDPSAQVYNEKLAVELYFLAKKFHIRRLKRHCLQALEDKLEQCSVLLLDKLVHEVASLHRTCYITSSYSTSTKEFFLPTSKVCKSMDTSFDTDITNTVEIQAEQCSLNIKGVQLLLNNSSRSEQVRIFCTVTDSSGDILLVQEIAEEISNTVSIVFVKEVVVHDGEKVKITMVVEDIKSNMCSFSPNNKYIQISRDEHIIIFISSLKSAGFRRKPLFFIHKIFYSCV